MTSLRGVIQNFPCGWKLSVRGDRHIRVKAMDSIVNVGTNIWIVKSLFSLGAGQTTGLQYEGLKARMLSMLPDGDASPELKMPNESTAAELEEETKQLKAMMEGGSPEFALDSTMTIIRFAEDKLLLHSPVGLSTDLIDQTKALGKYVTG